MIEVVMPEMGESVVEGTITRWLVKVGDAVERDQPIVEVSTDKVDAEIPSPAAGTLTEIRFDEGAVVQVSEVLALIAGDGDRAGATPSHDTGAAAASTAGRDAGGSTRRSHGDGAAAAAPRSARTGAAAKEEAVAGGARRAARAGEAPTVEGEEPPAVVGETGHGTRPDGGKSHEALPPDSVEDAGDSGGRRALVTPIARRIAEAEGVDVTRLRGSGAQGRVTKEDVLRAVDERKLPAASTTASAPGGAAPPARAAGATVTPSARAADGALHVRPWVEGERVEIEPMSRMRKLTTRHMTHSRDTSVHVTTVFHVDMTRVVEIRNRVKASFERDHGTKLTFMPFIFRALATALRAHPKFNASIDGETIVYKKDVNLGMAVALDWGLIVPVIHEADAKSLAGLAKTANDLADRARAKRLKAEEIQRGTFTVTNPGVFGSLFGTPIINQPQVAILCVGAIEKRPVVLTDADGRDAIAIRHMAYFALTYDHRLIDGADAEMFMRDVKVTLENETWSELQAT